MQKLISLTPAVAKVFHELTGRRWEDWFCAHDPVDRRLGSGGGTLHLMREAWRGAGAEGSFEDWIRKERGIILHAGGQSRRLPAYAAEGKALIPVPVYRWSLGQRIDQALLDLQRPFLEDVLAAAAESSRWLIGSGDVLLRAERLPERLPEADVVCLGLWGEPEQATRHGVFFTPRNNTRELSFMLQKPDLDEIRRCSRDHYFLLDIGVWLLSERAMEVLRSKVGTKDERLRTKDGFAIGEYDLYGEFGPAMGKEPVVEDPEINELSTAVVPLEGGEFYHFGSGPDLIRSCLRLQNRVIDQRRLSSLNIKPHPSLFVQNSELGKGLLRATQDEIWIENSHVPETWRLHRRHLITGIPENDWSLELPEGLCLDVVPMADGKRALRFYGIADAFRGAAGKETTRFCGQSFSLWLADRGLSLEQLDIDPACDLQEAPLFPVSASLPEEALVQWLLSGRDDRFAREYAAMERVSAEYLGSMADLQAIRKQREAFLARSLPVLAGHGRRSVFYQVDLEDLAEKYVRHRIELPDRRPGAEEDLFRHVRDAMFRSRVQMLCGQPHEADEAEAFAALRTALIETARADPVEPVLDCQEDQIVWGRSPVRLDLAGGWTDTPPYCFLSGGKVVNIAVELNGQPPIQAFARPRREPGIKLRSIDLGNSEELLSYDDLRSYAQIGSGFAIPKAALALCGFLPEFHQGKCPDDLLTLLDRFGGGLEISLLCAVPKGSGLGTSSILAATLLGVLNDLCQLGWDSFAIGNRVLVLEQMLTSGGGWQDQYGGICRGLKYLETGAGLEQAPRIRWIDDHLFTDPSIRPNILLYYTGITRVAKSVLGEIVRGMFLNSQHRLDVLQRIGRNAERLQEVLQEGDYAGLARSVAKSWELNKSLDPGTNPPEIEALLQPIQPYLAGCKLLGAGGGGYLLMLARDGDAAQRIKQELKDNPPNGRARFVDMEISREGLQVTRS